MPVAENVNMKLAQEQLQESDSTLRVEVPLMDFYTSAGTPNEHGNTGSIDLIGLVSGQYWN
jgi:hypothetical protein